MQINRKALFLACIFGAVSVSQAQQKELVTDPKAPQAQVPAPKINQAAIDKLGFKFGVQTYTFREMSLFETLDVMKHLGIHYAEMFPGQQLSKERKVKVGPGMSEEDLKALLDKAKECDVQLVSYGVTGIGDREEDVRKVFDWGKKVGLWQIVSEPKVDPKLFEMYDKICNEYGIKLAMHDHPKPSPYWNPDTVLMVTEGKSKMVGSCSDTGHWLRSGLVPVDCIKKLEGRVIELHLKDINEKKQDVPWGTGKVDAKGIMAELQRQGAKPLFATEYESSHGTELIRNVAECYANFSKFAEELTAGK